MPVVSRVLQFFLHPTPKGTWLKMAMVLAGAIGVGLAIFLSVRSSPAMTSVGWMPKWIGHWLDRHGYFRNFPAFAILAIPFLLAAPKFLQRACLIATLAALVVFLEIIQLWIPTRFADDWDVFWGWAGLFTAWGIFETIAQGVRRKAASAARLALCAS